MRLLLYTKISMPKIFVFGFPGNYGGAATEMYHQILLWLKMKIEVHLIPAWDPDHEDLFPVIKKSDVIIHTPLEWSSLSPDDAIIGYCSDLFLFYLPSIRKYTHRIIFINCMTFLFEEENKALKCEYIKILLYQNKNIMSLIKHEIDKLCLTNKIETMSIIPYFHEDDFVFHKNRDGSKFVCGRISRIDEKKYAKEIVPIYEGVISPVPKKGIFLGYGSQIGKKIGKLPNWIMTAQSHYSLSISEFIEHVMLYFNHQIVLKIGLASDLKQWQLEVYSLLIIEADGSKW